MTDAEFMAELDELRRLPEEPVAQAQDASKAQAQMVKMVAYGDFPLAYGKIDYTKVIVDYTLKDIPSEFKGVLEDVVRKIVSEGWTSFDFALDHLYQRPAASLLIGVPPEIPPEMKEIVARRLYEVSVWLIQRSLLMLVLRHGKQDGCWDGTPEDLDFESISGAQLEMPMSLIEGSNICVLTHGVQGGELVLKVFSTLV